MIAIGTGVFAGLSSMTEWRIASNDASLAPTNMCPMRTGPGAFTIVASSLTVLAVHPHPLRLNAYVDIRHAGIAGLEGLANTVTGAPARGEHLTDVKRVLFAAPGVATVQGLAEASKSTRAADRLQHREH